MNCRRLFVASVVCVLAFVAGLEAELSPDLKETADHLAASIYTGPSMSTLRELSDNFGGRLTGSPAYNRAAEWAVAQFRSYASRMSGWNRSPWKTDGCAAPQKVSSRLP